MLYKDYFISQRCPDMDIELAIQKYENTRLYGLEYFKQMPPNFTVLDIGCAEGFVSSKFGKWGAKIVHGVDRHAERREESQKINSDTTTYIFSHFNLTSSKTFDYNGKTYNNVDKFVYQSDWLLDEYDIVLMMGIHTFDQKVLDLLITLTKTYFVYRGEAASEHKEYLLQNGFQVILDDDDCANKIFKK